MSQRKIALILGAGPNVGTPTIKAFRQKGYLVAYSSRSASQEGNDEDVLPLKCDFARPKDVEEVFKDVRKTWGHPSVVIYNAYSHGGPQPDSSKTLSLSTEAFEKDLAVNTTSVFVAAREAVVGFEKLPSGPKTFLYTGNALIKAAYPPLFTLGLGKSASASMIQAADLAFTGEDLRFHFVDERQADGKPMWQGVSGQAHADFFLSVAERSAGNSIPWYTTFVKDKGYVEFPGEVPL